MAAAQPSYTNVFVPEVTKQLVVDYSRNPKDFLVNMLATTTPVDKPIGYYLSISPDAQARSGGGRQSRLFADGAARPIQTDNKSEHEYIKYFCQRTAYTDPIGYQTAKNATWDIKAQISRTLANKAMLDRAIEFYNILSTSGNYLSGHIDTATNWGGGQWSGATASNRYIQRSLMSAARRIIKSTVNGGVTLSDLFLVVSPTVADIMARSGEIADYIKESTAAPQYIEFKLWAEQNALYGLPQVLYGVKVVVDETIKDPVKSGETSAKAFLPGDTSAFLITKKGGVKSSEIGTEFSSVHFFVEKEWEMRTEEFDEPITARTIQSVTDSWEAQMVAKAATVCFTAVA